MLAQQQGMVTSQNSASWPYLFAAAIVFFLLWAAIFGIADRELLFDRLFAAVLVGLLWLFWRKFHFRNAALIATVLALLLHQLKLYGTTFIGLQFDNYMHFIGGFALALLLSDITAAALKPSHSHRAFRAFIIFTASVGLASLIEPLEYFGYATVGEGEGILGYGAGDGGWQDTAADMAANMLGAIVGLAFSLTGTSTSPSALPRKSHPRAARRTRA